MAKVLTIRAPSMHVRGINVMPINHPRHKLKSGLAVNFGEVPSRLSKSADPFREEPRHAEHPSLQEICGRRLIEKPIVHK